MNKLKNNPLFEKLEQNTTNDNGRDPKVDSNKENIKNALDQSSKLKKDKLIVFESKKEKKTSLDQIKSSEKCQPWAANYNSISIIKGTSLGYTSGNLIVVASTKLKHLVRTSQ